MARGHPDFHFTQGGRSRTGRLLQPKTGMLGMTVPSFLQEPVRPVVFVPVYFGYERLAEGSTYVGELGRARPKEKESVLRPAEALWRVLKETLRPSVYVNLGEPGAAAARVLEPPRGHGGGHAAPMTTSGAPLGGRGGR